MTDTINRRAFLRRSAATAGGAVVASSVLQRLTEHAALAAPGNNNGRGRGRGRNRRQAVEQSPGYGRLQRMVDQRGSRCSPCPPGSPT